MGALNLIKIKIMFFCVVLSIAILGLPVKVVAHSGGLNSQGCHAGSQPYHCHRTASEMVRTQDGRNRLRCDLGSRSSECAGRGYNYSEIQSYQRQLMRHCSHLPSGFADGIEGPSTRAALRKFQAAYGLVVDGVFGQQTAEMLAGPINGFCR